MTKTMGYDCKSNFLEALKEFNAVKWSDVTDGCGSICARPRSIEIGMVLLRLRDAVEMRVEEVEIDGVKEEEERDKKRKAEMMKVWEERRKKSG
jgi:hypothetical protein